MFRKHCKHTYMHQKKLEIAVVFFFEQFYIHVRIFYICKRKLQNLKWQELLFWKCYNLMFCRSIVKNVSDVKPEVDFEMDISECGNIAGNGEITTGQKDHSRNETGNLHASWAEIYTVRSVRNKYSNFGLQFHYSSTDVKLYGTFCLTGHELQLLYI